MFSHGRYYASHPATQLSMAEEIEELSPEMICSRKKASIQCGISTWQSWVRVCFFQFKSSRKSVISDFKLQVKGLENNKSASTSQVKEFFSSQVTST